MVFLVFILILASGSSIFQFYIVSCRATLKNRPGCWTLPAAWPAAIFLYFFVFVLLGKLIFLISFLLLFIYLVYARKWSWNQSQVEWLMRVRIVAYFSRNSLFFVCIMKWKGKVRLRRSNGGGSEAPSVGSGLKLLLGAVFFKNIFILWF